MTIDENIKLVLADLQKTSEQISVDKEAYFKQFVLPPTIGLGSSGVAFIGRDGVGAVNAVAKALRGNNPVYRRSVTQAEMTDRVSKAVGTIIARGRRPDGNTYDLPTDENAFCADVREALKDDLDGLKTDATHVFGAWVIQGDTIPSLEVGPVRFELRAHWLARVEAEGLLSAPQASILQNYWAQPDPPGPRTLEMGPAREVVEAVGPCPWVCTVRVTGHSIERSRLKALWGAKIALAGISLAWQSPSSQAKETGLLWDLGPFRVRHSMLLAPDGGYGAQHQSVIRYGRYLTQGDAVGFFSRTGRSLETIGRSLDTFLAVSPSAQKRQMEEALSQALMWFYEACGEPLEFMAIVKYAAALDTMAKGKMSKGITALVKHRLMVADEKAAFLSDGTSLEKLVKEVYEIGRSRIVHGTSASLIDDLEQLRARAELLTTVVLRACVAWLSNYAGNDDVAAFSNAT